MSKNNKRHRPVVTGLASRFQQYRLMLENGTYLVIPFPRSNELSGTIYGYELTGRWELSERWRVSACYSYMHFHLDNPTPLTPGNTAPDNQVRFQSSWDLGHDWDFDMCLRYVDAVPVRSVPAYLTMDLRLGWRPNKNLELALVGQNLLDNHHPEWSYEGFGYMSDEIRRTVFAQLTWRR